MQILAHSHTRIGDQGLAQLGAVRRATLSAL